MSCAEALRWGGEAVVERQWQAVPPTAKYRTSCSCYCYCLNFCGTAWNASHYFGALADGAGIRGTCSPTANQRRA